MQTQPSDAAFSAVFPTSINADRKQLVAPFPAAFRQLCWAGYFVLDNVITLHDPSLNRCREIPPEAAGGGIFDSFCRYNFQLLADNDVISVDNVAMDVRVKLGDSTPNAFRYIRGADFVSNERTGRDLTDSAKRLKVRCV